MKETVFDQFRILENDPSFENLLPYSDETAKQVLRFHRSIPGYRETRLVSLQAAARHFGVEAIYVKDESARFGLKAFKGLGGSYCMFRILCEKLGLDPSSADYRTFLREDIRRACAQTEFATATDGNHGKGVSWAAKLFGCKAYVFMPRGTVEARRRAAEEAGNAKAVITGLNYDQTVLHTASLVRENGWTLIQDTSWEGYEKIPGWIIEGYLTMAAEAAAGMQPGTPTHIFLQAGVGSMAGGVASYFINTCGHEKPKITIAEPAQAACFYESIRQNDGLMHSIPGDPVTIMAGLNCGTPCSLVWPVIRDSCACFCACEDSVTELGMRRYAAPLNGDPAVVSGESGAVTYGLLLSVLASPQRRELFGIGRDSVILLFNTEGNTDPNGYKRVISGGS